MTDSLVEVANCDPAVPGHGESNEGGPILPYELLLPIMEELARRGHRRTLFALGATSRNCLLFALPFLYRDLDVRPPHFDVKKLEHMLRDSLNSDKFSKVKSLRCSMTRDPWAEASLLRRCLPTLTSLSAVLGYGSHAELLLAYSDSRCPNLSDLELILPSDAVWTARAGYRLPSRVHKLSLYLSTSPPKCERKFMELLESSAGQLDEFRLTSFYRPDVLSDSYPGLFAKLCSLRVDAVDLPHAVRLDLPHLEELEIRGLSSDRLWSHLLDSFPLLKTLILSRSSTLCLLHGLPRGLDLLLLDSPNLSLPPDDFPTVRFAIKEARIPRIVVSSPSTFFGMASRYEEEKAFWKEVIGCEWKD